jgi:hypothetical protein
MPVRYALIPDQPVLAPEMSLDEADLVAELLEDRIWQAQWRRVGVAERR